jgi:hypothetical protein
MKQRIILALGLIAASLPAWSQTNVGVSVAVSQPGVYGRIDIGNVPQPPVVVYPQPVIIAPPQHVVVQPQPVYLYVPPGHQKHWAKHCAQYNACGQPVYFVQENWYRTQYVPAVQRHDHDRDDGDHGHGNGNGKGKGHGKGHKD